MSCFCRPPLPLFLQKIQETFEPNNKGQKIKNAYFSTNLKRIHIAHLLFIFIISKDVFEYIKWQFIRAIKGEVQSQAVTVHIIEKNISSFLQFEMYSKSIYVICSEWIRLMQLFKWLFLVIIIYLAVSTWNNRRKEQVRTCKSPSRRELTWTGGQQYCWAVSCLLGTSVSLFWPPLRWQHDKSVNEKDTE